MDRTIDDELKPWIAERPRWEKLAYAKVSSGRPLTSQDYADLLHCLLDDHKLAESPFVAPVASPETPENGAAQTAPVRRYLLDSVSLVKNVAGLVEGQSLPFSSGLTVVFGANGSGKSSYARLIASAGRTRGDSYVLPDVAAPAADAAMPTATFRVVDGDCVREVPFAEGQKPPEMGSFFVFDSASIHKQLTQENEFSFAPAGLERLTQLAEVVDKVKALLLERIDLIKAPKDFLSLFQGQSTVRDLIASLSSRTPPAELVRLATFTDADRARLREVELSLDKLRKEGHPIEVVRLRKALQALQDLDQSVAARQRALGADAEAQVRSVAGSLRAAEAAAERHAVAALQGTHGSSPTSKAWREFAAAAKALATASEPAAYPELGHHCILCGQTLTPDSLHAIQRVWQYVEGTAHQSLIDAHARRDQLLGKLRALQLDTPSLAGQDADFSGAEWTQLAKSLQAFDAACAQRRTGLVDLVEGRDGEPAPLSALALEAIGALQSSLQARLERLDALKPDDRVAQLEAELCLLEHRRILSSHVNEVSAHVRSLHSSERAQKIRPNTRHISTLYDRLFRNLVTEGYIQAFNRNLERLERPANAQVVTLSKKGRTVRRIALGGSEGEAAKVGPERVLSEGEKRVVALADFLTEASLDDRIGGIVLDDPVTSLDSQWKHSIAKVVIEEAKGGRQVVVFTHDLPFLYLLKQQADASALPLTSHWIKRGEFDRKPGYVFPNNSPVLEEEYKAPTRAREFWERLKRPGLSAEDVHTLLQQGFGALRTSYEAFIIFEVLNKVVLRFDERLSVGRLTEVVVTPEFAAKLDDAVGRLSRHIEAHSHSDNSPERSPTQGTLLDEINKFEVLRKEYKEKKAQLKSK